MKEICIVTDGTAQFPKPHFTGSNHIHVVPFQYAGSEFAPNGIDALKPRQLPVFIPEGDTPLISAPDVGAFRQCFWQLADQYETIFAIFLSNEICGAYANALEAADSVKGKVNLQVIDSMTTSVGLGLLIERVFTAAQAGKDADEINHMVRSLIPRLYTLFCTPGLSYLHRNRFLDQAQSVISEMLGIVPIFTLEEGRLTPIEKVNSVRQALLYFQEFLEEFDQIEHVGYVQSASPNFGETRSFFGSIAPTFSEAALSNNIINLPLAAIFGPLTSCLIILEDSLR